MAITNRIRTQYYDDVGSVAELLKEYTGESEFKLNVLAPDAATTEYQLAIDVSALQSVVMISTKNVTLKTNSSGAPDSTVVLVANEPKMWSADVGGTNPFVAADVTSIFIVNASGAAAAVRITGLVDATP
jgi:hypothetical protein